jgi:hypothetical protein
MSGKSGLVIRTVFNNQGWAGRCVNPTSDPQCFKCAKGLLPGINQGNPIHEDEDGLCQGNPDGAYCPGDSWCWEQNLCKKFYWRRAKEGQWSSVSIGMPVYFVYPEFDKSLTLWGQTLIDKIENENPCLSTLYFKPFKPLPRDEWVRGLNGKYITGQDWKQGQYRYLDKVQDKILRSLINKEIDVDTTHKHLPSPRGYDSVNVQLKKEIRDKLERIAEAEGRDIEEIIREATAKLIRERGY